MVGQANIINRFAGVHMEDIRGIRVPFLRVGWNRQFLMMKEFGFVYDASMAAPLSDPPIWPYTLDYKMPHGCVGTGQRCPSRSFPGIWEMVLNQLEVEVWLWNSQRDLNSALIPFLELAIARSTRALWWTLVLLTDQKTKSTKCLCTTSNGISIRTVHRSVFTSTPSGSKSALTCALSR